MRVRISPQRLVAAARARTQHAAGSKRASHLSDEGGFSLVEGVTALVLIFGIMLGLFASLNTGVRGLLTGRERYGALSVAKAYVEKIRSACYPRIGHDPDDTTLPDDDDNLTGPDAAGNYVYDPDVPDTSGSFTGETLAYAETCGGTLTAVIPEHFLDDQDVGTLSGNTGDHGTYDVWIYITHVNASSGVPHKRITVVVQMNNAQYSTSSGVSDKVRISSLVYDGVAPTDPLVEAEVDTDGGSFAFAGTMYDPDSGQNAAPDLDITYPHAYGVLRANVITELGPDWARTHSVAFRDEQNEVSSPAPGCTDDADGHGFSCPSDQTAISSDDDSNTSKPSFGTDSTSVAAVGWDVSTLYSIDVGGGTADSDSTPCPPGCGSLGDNDSLPRDLHSGDGPDGWGFDYSLQPLDVPQLPLPPLPVPAITGSFVEAGSTASEADIDQDASGSNTRTQAVSRNVYSDVDLLTIDNLGITMVSIGGGSIEGTADVGTAAGGADFSGTLTISVFGQPTSIPVSPSSAPVNVNFPIPAQAIEGVATLSGSVSIVTQQGTTDEEFVSGAYTMASAEVDDWLIVTVSATLVTADDTLFDVSYSVNYGDLSAYAEGEV
ncbi:MAG: hypothetical protein HYU28_01850 [Actinobacteria bacterium]|nr:hypothetical protein [Actinomycetota bacterium]